MPTFLLLAVLVLGGLTGCTHTPSAPSAEVTAPVPIPNATDHWKALLAAQASRESALQTSLGKMSVEFESAHDSIRGLGTAGVAFPDNFLLEIRDPLGRLHFRAVSQGEHFEGYFPRHQKLYQDSRSGRRFFQKTWQLPISFPELSRLSAGLLPKAVAEQLPGPVMVKGELLETSVLLDGVEVGVQWKADTQTLTQITWRRKEGELQVSYRDFRPCCQTIDPKEPFTFAHVIEVKGKDSLITIDWKGLQPWQAGAEAFKIQTSSTTKVIQLD